MTHVQPASAVVRSDAGFVVISPSFSHQPVTFVRALFFKELTLWFFAYTWKRSRASTSRRSSSPMSCTTILGIKALKNVRLVNRYDVEGISEELFAQATPTVFSEPQVDNVSADLPDFGDAHRIRRGIPARPVRPARGFRQRVHPADLAGRAPDGAFRQGVCAGGRALRSRCRGHQALRDQPGGSA